MARADIHNREGRLIFEAVLSERNLLALLTKLHTTGSACTIYNNDVFVEGVDSNLYELKLIAETDDVHYGRRLDPPGEMHPMTEQFIAGLQEYIKNFDATLT